jgi:glycosyltransferase involved in cell wall biosynthesis
MTGSVGKRILMLLENQSYPEDTRVLNEARELVQHGYQVTLICPAKKTQKSFEILDGVRIYRYHWPRGGEGLLGYLWEYGLSLFFTFWLTLWVFVRHGFDAIHSHSPPDLYFLIAAPYKLLGKKFVFDHHDISPEMYEARFPDGSNRRMYKILMLCEKLTCRLANHIISVNESYKKLVVERHGIPAANVTVVRNGPNFHDRYAVDPDLALRDRKQTILGYVGVMGYQDGIDSFIRAMHQLRHTLGRTDFYAVLIGKGSSLQSLKDLVKELDISEHCWFTGFVSNEDLLKLLSSTDICIAPDPYNSFNDRSTMIKVLEYMTFRKPIVAYRLVEHQVSAGDAALYANVNDELDFAKKIQELMDNPGLRQQMGHIGRKRIEDVLAWQHQAPHLLQAYETVFARNTKSA